MGAVGYYDLQAYASLLSSLATIMTALAMMLSAALHLAEEGED